MNAFISYYFFVSFIIFFCGFINFFKYRNKLYSFISLSELLTLFICSIIWLPLIVYIYIYDKINDKFNHNIELSYPAINKIYNFFYIIENKLFKK